VKRKTDNFSKFFEKKKKSGAIKEAFRQEKKAAKKERKDGIERHFEQKRQAKAARFGDGSGNLAPGGVTAIRAFPEKPTSKRPPNQKGRPPKASPGKPAFVQRFGPGSGKPANLQKPGIAPGKPENGQRSGPPQKSLPTQKPGKAPVKFAPTPKPASAQKPAPGQKPASAKKPAAGQKQPPPPPRNTGGTAADLIPLNKYIAHGGICSRRDAAELIRQGRVSVNGQPVTEPGTRVAAADIVKLNGKKITMSRNFVYILLNKPKDYITTTEDPQGRKTVLDLIRPATTERVYPVGRLDRNTSGVLLLTNDGDLAQKLAHPSHEVKKIYHVTLDKVLTKGDFEKIVEGVTLDDGLATVDVIAYADAKDKTQVGLEIHSGRNRIVRRIFEHLGYDVRGLDRVTYAGLTKKNVQRGKWRLLTEKEIRILKYLNSAIRTTRPGSPAALSAKNNSQHAD
jgi:23S rRNA pseudouridine2605 synthase